MNPQRQDSSLEPRTHRCLRGSGQRPIKTLYLEPCSLWHFHQHTLASQQLSSLGMISPKFFMCLPAVLFPLGIQSTSLPNFIDGPHSAFLPEATQEFSWESSSPFLIVCDSSVPLHIPHQWKLLFSEDTENLNGQYSFPSQASHLLPPPFESDFQNEVFFYFLWTTPFIHISIHLYVIKKKYIVVSLEYRTTQTSIVPPLRTNSQESFYLSIDQILFLTYKIDIAGATKMNKRLVPALKDRRKRWAKIIVVQ